LLQDAFLNGIVVLTAAGNDRKIGCDVINDIPGAHARPASFPNQMIVVGSVDATGAITPSSNIDSGNLVTGWLNGRSVLSASPKGDRLYSTDSGTSFSTAIASGYVAGLLKHPTYGPIIRAGGNQNVATVVKSLMGQMAVRTGVSGIPIINNQELGRLTTTNFVCQKSPLG
jgi:hypothetical protein